MTSSPPPASPTANAARMVEPDTRIDHYENFPVASVLLPKALRWPVAVIYRFARSADDLADEGNAPAEARLAALEAYSEELTRIERGLPPATPLFADLAQVIQQHTLPLQPFRDLLSAFSQDVRINRAETSALVLDYCTRSANPVGRLMLQLYGAATPERIAQSNAICTGLQLANFCQDVALDWAKDRIYLPADACVRYGVTEAHIAQGTCDAAWQSLMAEWVGKARAMLQSGAPLALDLPAGTARRIGWELRLVVQGGLRILERIESVQYDVFRHRPTLGPADWAIMLYRAVSMRRTTA